MVSKEMRRLSRRELVDVIYQLKKNEEQLREELTALQESVDEKRIRIATAGSIAEAAMDITQIFHAAQSTADLYLQEISLRKEETEAECERILQEAREQAEAMLAEVEQQRQQLQLEKAALEAMKNSEEAEHEEDGQ